jgi:hypothetical protein
MTIETGSNYMHAYCTIVSSHYLPQALTLAKSFETVYPEDQLSVLVIDVKKDSLPIIPNIKFYYLEELPVDSDVLKRMLTYYDVVEFATALKPIFLLKLLSEKNQTVSYIDPDIYLLDRLGEAQELAKRLGMAITPHRLSTMPFRPESPRELSFLRVGIYNLGFICVGPRSLPLLSWWQERLRWHASQFDQLPYFTDQRWADFFPSFEGCAIIRHPGYNVAYWNLDERNLHEKAGKYFAGELPVVFVHFSQMSTQLMKSLKSELWGEWLDKSAYDQHSIQLIRDLSQTYGIQLRRNLELVNNLTFSINTWFSSVSKFKQMKIVRKDISRSKSRSLFGKGEIPSSQLGKLFERSYTYKGFRIGLQKDLARIKKRLAILNKY